MKTHTLAKEPTEQLPVCTKQPGTQAAHQDTVLGRFLPRPQIQSSGAQGEILEQTALVKSTPPSCRIQWAMTQRVSPPFTLFPGISENCCNSSDPGLCRWT